MRLEPSATTRGDLRPIETKYKGYRFRSRLEARWAVYFDALKIEWHYEPEGFDLGSAGPYLPDFWLPQVHMYAEVKPIWPNTAELDKIIDLAKVSERPVLVLDGMPDFVNYWACYPVTYIGDLLWIDCILDDDNKYWITEGRFYSCTGESPFGRCDSGDSSLADGVAAARSARFEHGENGGVR